VNGGTTFWINVVDGLDASDLVYAAERKGVLIEPVDRYFASGEAPKGVFRAGVASIPAHRIRDGVVALMTALRESAGIHPPRLEFVRQSCLRGDSLKRAVAGASFLFKTTYGEPGSIQILRDGRLVGSSGYANEERDEGRWWVENDMWFRQWNNWAYGEVSGYFTHIESDTIHWFTQEGRSIGSAIYVRPENESGSAARL
jgi:GntR family transcriptional regulator/MocR family aminotransferase